MLRAEDQLEIAMDGASGGSARNSDGWCERWIRERATDDASDGSEINRRSDGWC
jgi:hypothetical protein